MVKSQKKNSNVEILQGEMESITMNAISMINKIPGFENFTTPESMSGTGSGDSPQEARNAPVEEKRVACLNNMPSMPGTSWTSADFKSICQPLCPVPTSAPTSLPTSASAVGVYWSKNTIGVTAGVLGGLFIIIVLLGILCKNTSK